MLGSFEFPLIYFLFIFSLSQCARTLIVTILSSFKSFATLHSYVFMTRLCVVMQLNYMLPQSTFCIIAVVSVLTLISQNFIYFGDVFLSIICNVFFD